VDNEHSKPKVGMIFDALPDVEKFYKSYVHGNGFTVRVGQYYFAREGYRKESVKDVRDESGKKERHQM
jgi:hypothetical protein